MTAFCTDHAIERAAERYGLDFTQADCEAIVAATKDGRACKLRHTETGGDVFVWRYRGHVILPVVNDFDTILTFLPIKWLFRHKRRYDSMGWGKQPRVLVDMEG